MAKKITQETFDEVVRENMEEFDLSREDAVKDAIEQFTSQGVDLSCIVTDNINGSGDLTAHPVLQALQYINDHLDQPDLSEQLNIVKNECDKDLSRRCLAGQNGFNTLLKLCEKQNDNLLTSLDALCSLCNGQPDVLNHSAIGFFISILNSRSDKEVLMKTLKVIRYTCVKHEDNRQSYVSFDVISVLMTTLRNYRSDGDLVVEVCSALRTLTLDDDIRVQFGKSHEHAKMIVAEDNALKTILEISQVHSGDSAVVGDLYLTLAKLSVRNEFCQEILDLGGVEMILKSFQQTMDNQTTVRQILTVLKALAGNDTVKVTLANNGGLHLILECLQKHIKQTAICELGCAALATLVLRQPKSCQLAMEAGAAQTIVQVLQIHTDSDSVQKQACMATRNLVARTKEYTSVFIELGVEPLINRAMNQHKTCQDEAKAALRDLDCKVELRELWKGERGQLQQ